MGAYWGASAPSPPPAPLVPTPMEGAWGITMRKRHNTELEQPSGDRVFHDPLGLFQSASSQNLSKCMETKCLIGA